MCLTLIKNPDATQATAYSVARVVYAETGASSLPVVEAMTAMIANLAKTTGRNIQDIISDPCIFECLRDDDAFHHRISVECTDRRFQMCLRVAQRMMRGMLPDVCRGATRFHRADSMPEWAVARGYIADIDGILFYL